jgi:hypothetical protein
MFSGNYDIQFRTVDLNFFFLLFDTLRKQIKIQPHMITEMI